MLAPSPLTSFDPFVIAIAAYMNGQHTAVQRDKVFREFFESSRVQKIAAKHEFEFNLKGDRDEIVQGMALIFLDKYLDRLDDPNNIYTLLYSVSRNVALTVKGSLLLHDSRYISLAEPDSSNRRSMRPVDHEVQLNKSQELVELASEDFTLNVEQAIDRRRAEEKLALRFAKLDPVLLARLDEPHAPAERKPRVQMELSTEARELIMIRDRMRLDNRRFALALGIEHPLLCAYIYGRTKKIREQVMLQARNMYSNRGGVHDEVLARLSRRSMRRIVTDWLEAVGEQPGQPGFTMLGAVLGVNWHTVRRWQGDEFKPPLDKLQALDQIVQKLAARLRADKTGESVSAVNSANRRGSGSSNDKPNRNTHGNAHGRSDGGNDVSASKTGKTGAGAIRRRVARAAAHPRNKVVGNRRPTPGQSTALRQNASSRVLKRKVKAMSDASMPVIPESKLEAPAKVSKAVKKAPAKVKATKPVAKKTAKKAPAKVAKAVKKAPSKVKATKPVVKKAPAKTKTAKKPAKK